MPSETIWSSASTSPMQSNTNLNPQYKSVLDQVDPEVAKLFGNSNPLDSLTATSSSGRRFSFNDGSDIDGSNFFGIKRGTFSAITAPVGNHYGATTDIIGGTTGGAGGAGINFGTASISGGIASRHPPQDSFLQKFSTVADATREIELGKLSLKSTSPGTNEPIKSLGALNSSPHGSLNENLNMPIPRSSRQQSISEKIDNYNNNSPIQASTSLSINSDLSGDKNLNNTAPANQRFWNPATATSFTPTYNYFMDPNQMPPPPPPQAGFYRNGQVMPPPAPISPPPPFMIPSPPPPQFVDPALYGMMDYGGFPPPPPHMMPPQMMPPPVVPTAEEEEGSDENKEKKDKDDKSPINITGGIGLMNRQFSPASFMFHPFTYSPVMSQSPPTQPPVLATAPAAPAPAVATNNNSKQGTPTPNSRELQGTSPHSSGNKRKTGKAPAGKAPGGNHIYRSPLLEEIRANPKDKEFFLKDIYGHAVEFTKDQYGSRFIQQKLNSSSDEEKATVFNEIKDISYDLMTDVFGNYVIQKYFEYGLKDQKEFLLTKMKGHIYELSLQMYGCRVVQRALESLSLPGQLAIIDELKDYILICAKDQNGNHVIQKSIEMIKPFDKIRFILTSLSDQIYQLSIHPYGCRVIQRLLEFSNLDDQKDILEQLNRYIFYLIQDQYGNYVIQHILEHGNENERNEILKVVTGSVVTFSKHKFASNVIEKCIKFGSTAQKRKILDEVMIGNEDFSMELVSDDSSLALMMKDQYANYVIQKLVEGFDSKSPEKKRLVLKLRQYLKQISNKNNYGGKHLASVEKMIIVAETALDD